jgi:putative ATPase
LSLFKNIPQDSPVDRSTPLADRMRPRSLEEFAGQEQLIGPGKPLRVQIERDDIGSIIFWGPPGVGKTTLAKIIARRTNAEFIEFSAVLTGIKEIKQVMADAERARQYGTRTIVFIDEIHRFNKAQQDAFLPHVERGNIRLIGATTENPSFEVISALLSRSRVYVLNPLSEEQIVGLLNRALKDEERGIGALQLSADDDALAKLAAYASGDARSAYNALEVSATLAIEDNKGASGGRITSAMVERRAAEARVALRQVRRRALQPHLRFAQVGAQQRSRRGPLLAGEDDRGRRGPALHRAPTGANGGGRRRPRRSARAATRRGRERSGGFHRIPRGQSRAGRSRCLHGRRSQVECALHRLRRGAATTSNGPLPTPSRCILRNAPTKLMKEVGYGDGYQYAHDLEEKVADMQCLPDNLKGRTYYRPTSEGVEKRIQDRLALAALGRLLPNTCCHLRGGAELASAAITKSSEAD